MKYLKSYLLIAFLLSSFSLIKAQHNNSQLPSSIRSDGLPPDSSAILHVQDTTRGVLVPRITDQQRDAIGNPATGLLVFVTTDSSFYYYDGSIWVTIDKQSRGIVDADGDTKVQVEASSDEDMIRFEVDGKDVVIVDSSGDVGIHTLTPNASLEIVGDLKTGNLEPVYSGLQAINLEGGSSSGDGVNVSGNHVWQEGCECPSTTWSGSYTTTLPFSEGDQLRFQTGGGWNAYKRVEIKAASSPTWIQVFSTFSSAYFWHQIDSTTNYDLRFYYSLPLNCVYPPLSPPYCETNNVHHYLQMKSIIDTVKTTNFVVDSLGQVGIGTASPSAKLEVLDGNVVVNNGKIGIGTTNPLSQLEVQYNSTSPASIVIDQNNAIKVYTGLNLQRLGSEKWFVGMNPINNNLVFRRSAISDDLVIDESGNVGIGTSAPGDQLQVVGSIRMVDGNEGEGKIPISDVNGRMIWTDQDAIVKDSQILSLVNDTLFLSNSGFVLLDPYLDNTDDQSLNLQNDTLYLVNGGFVLLDPYLDNTDDQGLSLQNDTLSLTNGGFVDLNHLKDADTFGNHIATQNIRINGNWLSGDGDSEGMFIDTSGHVGIGTDSPDTTLHVSGSIKIADGTQQADYVLTTDADGLASWQALSAVTAPPQIKDVDADTKVQAEKYGDEDRIRFDVAGSEAMIIDYTKKVGIGTSAPGATLDVKCNESSPAVIIIDQNHVDTEYAGLNIQRQGTEKWFLGLNNSNHNLIFRRSGISDDLVLHTSGNIGIGTSNPTSKLHVQGDIRVVDDSDILGLDELKGYNDLKLFGDLNGGPDVMIAPNGNVGIGTTTPSATLEIQCNDPEPAAIVIDQNHVNPAYTGLFVQRQGVEKWFLGMNDNNDNLILRRSGTFDHLVIHTNGNVGISTSNPSSKLSLANNLGDGAGAPNGGLTFNSMNAGGYGHAAIYTDGSGGYNGSLIFATDGDGTNNYNPTEKMRIQHDGNVGIGTATPSNILTVVQSSSTDPIADAWTTYSSRRWKTNINTIDNALNTVSRLRGVSYDWKQNGQHDIGLIAEEVGKVLPEIVQYEENGVDARSVDYARLVPVLIEAIKELKLKNERLERDVEELKMKLKVPTSL